MNIKDNGQPKKKITFDLEELHDAVLQPLIKDLCDKAKTLGAPIFVITCYRADESGIHLASSARGRGDFVPNEFILIRAVVEGHVEVIAAVKG